MKKIISVMALILALMLAVSACTSRKEGESEETTKDLDQILQEMQQEMDAVNQEQAVAEVVYKAYDDHAEVVGCNLPVGAVEILAEFEGKKVTKIAKDAFRGMNTITSVIIPETVTTIEEGAFMSCIALTAVSMHSGLETIGEYAFFGCVALHEIELPVNVKTIGANAFGSCTSMKAFKLVDGNAAFSVEDGVLYSADGATLVSYPAGKDAASYTLPESVKKISDFAFAYAKELTTVDVSGVESIGDYTFSSCAKLENVELGDKLTFIGAGTFQKCTALKSIVIPEGITALGYKNSSDVECGASFYGCTALTTVSLPSTIKNIYLRSFEGCDALAQVTYNGSAAEWSKVVIGQDNKPLTDIGVVTK